MLDTLRPALVVTRREVRDQFRDWRIFFPIIGLTLFFPFLMNFTAGQMIGFVQRFGADIIAERLVPFLLLITGFFPISVSLVIALESFVGERERGSIEPLLNSPLHDWQLYLGKLIAVTVPPLLYSYVGMAVYLFGLWRQQITMPEPALLVQIFVLTTVQAVMMVSGAVVVSTQATSVRAANLLASFIIIPSALLIQGESVMMFWGNYNTLWWAVVGLIVLSILLVRIGLAHFQREELLGREIDVLNVRWIWRVFRSNFSGGARSLGGWYAHLFRQALPEMKRPVLIMLGLTAAAMLLGVRYVETFQLPATTASVDEINQRLNSLLTVMPALGIKPVLLIAWQNLRVLLFSLILGTLTLGVLGVIPYLLTMGIAGYLGGTMAGQGMPVMAYVGLILPHGILEIPAAILATAAVLQVGAILATPTPGKTVGEVWLAALANWSKIMVGLVLPMLLAAAVVEAWVTPRIALLLFR